MNEGINNVACQPSNPMFSVIEAYNDTFSLDCIATCTCAVTGEHNTEEVRLIRQFVYG